MASITFKSAVKLPIRVVLPAHIAREADSPRELVITTRTLRGHELIVSYVQSKYPKWIEAEKKGKGGKPAIPSAPEVETEGEGDSDA